jgi:outer membrane lipopolysaccharide assembly protein LptE/RlpB
MRYLRHLVLALMLVPLSGCGYSLAGRGSFLPSYIKTIGVPTFTNQTTVFDLERKVSERVRNEFISRGNYNVVEAATGVDALLTGEISSVTLTPSAFTEQQLASRYVVTLTAKLEFRDLKSNKVLWQNPSMQFREEYSVSSTTTLDPNAFFGQDATALERLVTEFSRSVVSAILEAF